MLRQIALVLGFILFGLESLAFYGLLLIPVLEFLTAPLPCTKQPDCANWRSLASVSPSEGWLVLAGLGVYVLTALVVVLLADNGAGSMRFFFGMITFVPLLLLYLFLVIFCFLGLAIAAFLVIELRVQPLIISPDFTNRVETVALTFAAGINAGLVYALYTRMKESPRLGPLVERVGRIGAWIFWWNRLK